MAEGTEDRGTEQDGTGEPPEATATPAHEERDAIEHTRRLVELFLCDEDQLESYRGQWLPPASPASLDQLRAARLLLHRLALVLEAEGTEAWSRLASLAAALDGVVPSRVDVTSTPAPGPVTPAPVKPQVPVRTMVDGSAAEAVSAWARDPAGVNAAPSPGAPPPVGEAYRPGSGPSPDPPAPEPVPSGPPAMTDGASPAPPPLVPTPTPAPDVAEGSPPAPPVMSESAAPPTAKDAYPPVPAAVPPPKPPPAGRPSKPAGPDAPSSPAPPPPVSDGSGPSEVGRPSDDPPEPAPADAAGPPNGPPDGPPEAEPAKAIPQPPPSAPTAVSPGALPPPPEPDSPATPSSPAERPAWPGAAPTGDEATQLHTGEQLPLGDGGGAPVPSPDPAPAGEAYSGTVGEDEDELQETVAVETMSPLKQVLAAGPEAANLPDLTLQQYASFCAEQQVRPADVAMTRQKYGIADEATHAALDAHWERLLDTQPSIRERLQGLVTEYVTWLRQQG